MQPSSKTVTKKLPMYKLYNHNPLNVQSQKVKYTPPKLCWNSEKIPQPTYGRICGSIVAEALPKRQLRYQNLELEQAYISPLQLHAAATVSWHPANVGSQGKRRGGNVGWEKMAHRFFRTVKSENVDKD